MSLVAHYRLDGNANDSSTNKLHGTASNVSWVDGKLRQAGSFPNTNSRVSIPNLPGRFERFSVSCWCYLSGNSGDNYQSILNQSDDGSNYRFSFYVLDSSKELAGWIRPPGGSTVDFNTGQIIPLDTWIHVVYIFNKTDIKVFYQGDLVFEQENLVSSIELHDTLKATIGTYVDRNSYEWNGLIDDVRIYDHVLSEKDIKELSRAKVAHYKLDHPDFLSDSSGNLPAATNNGATFTTDSNIGSGCYEFDGTNTLTVENPLYTTDDANQEWSVTAWTKLTTTGSNQTLINGINNGLHLVYGSNDRPLLYLNSGANDYYRYAAVNGALLGNQWKFISFVFKNSDLLIKIYIDGQEVPLTGPTSGVPSGMAQTITIGNGVLGKIDDLRFYTKALTLEETKEIYQQRASITDQGQLYSSNIEQSPRARYIRDWLNGSTSNGGNHWVEIQAIDFNGTNVALGKPVTTNGSESGTYPISRITDGSLDSGSSGYASVSSSSPVWVQIDLGRVFNIDEVIVHHYRLDGRTYYGTKTEVSEDGVNWTTIFDSAIEGTYQETASGKTHDVIPLQGNRVSHQGVQAEEASELGITDGLVAYFPFDRDVKDYSGNNNHGTNNGSVQTTGILGNARSFDGTNYILSPNFYNPASLTVMCWVRFDALGANWIINKRDNGSDKQWQMQNYTGGSTSHTLKADISSGSDFIASAGYYGTLQTDTWYFAAFTTDGVSGGDLSFYFNGSLSESATLPADMKLGARDLVIGTSGWDLDSQYRIEGDIDDVKIFNRALSPEEINIEYKRGLKRLQMAQNSVYTSELVET